MNKKYFNLIGTCSIFIFCGGYSLPDIKQDYNPVLPPVNILTVYHGFGTTDINLTLTKTIIEQRTGFPIRTTRYASIYNMEDVQYWVEYISNEIPNLITIKTDRFLFVTTNQRIYYGLESADVMSELGQPRVHGSEWFYDSLGVGFGLSGNKVDYVFVFKPTQT